MTPSSAAVGGWGVGRWVGGWGMRGQGKAGADLSLSPSPVNQTILFTCDGTWRNKATHCFPSNLLPHGPIPISIRINKKEIKWNTKKVLSYLSFGVTATAYFLEGRDNQWSGSQCFLVHTAPRAKYTIRTTNNENHSQSQLSSTLLFLISICTKRCVLIL